jgi:hypothetical protein
MLEDKLTNDDKTIVTMTELFFFGVEITIQNYIMGQDLRSNTRSPNLNYMQIVFFYDNQKSSR